MSMKFAIRDDDASFFTCPEELEKAYGFLQDGCISLSVVPNAVPRHTDTSKPYGNRDFGSPVPLAENPELIAYLRKGIAAGRYDILLHGYSHEYQNRDGSWIPEMLWKDSGRLSREIREGKTALETLLHTRITTFAAPSNQIGPEGIAALEENGLNFCGIIHGFRSRKLTPRMALQFGRRWAVRLLHGIQVPGVLDYGTHLECNAYPLNNDALLDKEYAYCRQHSIPFVIYTHYWKLNEDAEEKRKLLRMVEKLRGDGAECVSVSSLFEQ